MKKVIVALLPCLLALGSCAVRKNNEEMVSDVQESPSQAGKFLSWNNGTGANEAAAEVHVVVPDKLVIIRQSIRTGFEAPFLYLIMGPQKAFLLDTGAGGATPQLVAAVKKYMGARKLFFTHTHGHNDHIAGDSAFSQFATFLPFGRVIEGLDLGDRKLEIFPIPGHQPQHIAVWDPTSKALFTGDTIYPGNLYALDWPRYQNSLQKLADFVSKRDVDYVLGAHIEIQDDGKTLFAFRSMRHPHERHLEMTKEDVIAINKAIKGQPPVDRKYKGDGWVVRTTYP